MIDRDEVELRKLCAEIADRELDPKRSTANYALEFLRTERANRQRLSLEDHLKIAVTSLEGTLKLAHGIMARAGQLKEDLNDRPRGV